MKAIVNCSLCPLGAITHLKNGEILADLFLNSLMKKVVEEILMILPENISIDFDEAFDLIEQIIQQSASHKCSMLQDVENGRRTEIDSLNGAIVVIAASQGVKVPLNVQLTEIVKKLTEEKYPKELAILDLRKLS
ncbi:2-dehydropantoate 2-reductase [subsurface metagenome]